MTKERGLNKSPVRKPKNRSVGVQFPEVPVEVVSVSNPVPRGFNAELVIFFFPQTAVR